MRRIFLLTSLAIAALGCSVTGGETSSESSVSQSQQMSVGGQNAVRHVETSISGGFFHTFDALKLGDSEARKVQVFLPNGYDASTKTYPVIVMNDGHTAFFDGDANGRWPKGYWKVGETLSALYASGKIREVIVIAVHPMTIAGRAMEYTHDKMADDQPMSECCGLDTYTKYITNSFMPWAQRNYRISLNAKERMILGASHGGLASTYIAMERPDLFGVAVGMSSSLWIGLDTFKKIPFTDIRIPWVGITRFRDQKYYAHMKENAAKLSDPAVRPTIYLDWGTRRMGDQSADAIEGASASRSKELASILVRDFGYVEGKDVQTLEDPQGVHDESAWVGRFPAIVQRYFGR